MAAKKEKETCSKCGSTIYAVAQDKTNKHYCQAKGCGNVWVPGLEGLKRPDIVLKQAQEENIALKAEVNKLRAENKQLKLELKDYAEASQEEIFT